MWATRDRRKQEQENHAIVFDTAKMELEDYIDDIEGADIRENMLMERREWVQK